MSKLHEHNLPSVEMLIRLCAFCVPTTFIQYTGCVWAAAESGLLCKKEKKINRLFQSMESIVRLFFQNDISYLYRCLLLNTIVPHNNLSTVGTSDDEVGMESGKRRYGHWWLTMKHVFWSCLLEPCIPNQANTIRIMCRIFRVFIIRSYQ